MRPRRPPTRAGSGNSPTPSTPTRAVSRTLISGRAASNSASTSTGSSATAAATPSPSASSATCTMPCAGARRERRPCGSPGLTRTCSIPWSRSEYETHDELAHRPTGGHGKAAHMSSDAVTTVSVEIAGSEISFETGKMARQASGAVVVRQGDTMVLSTATIGNLRDVDFLPLTVDVEERMYAAGKIPGSFFKREGRAGEKGTLTARMIDRPLRPLFPKGWHYETQLVNMPLSVDHEHSYDVLAMNGASAALMISPVPLPTPVGAVRIGKIEGNFVVNPSEADLVDGHSDLDLVVAGTEE